ncbi:MAG: hypothetical protein AB1779_02410 [Candidatus Thermoplasmatota archaeon]
MLGINGRVVFTTIAVVVLIGAIVAVAYFGSITKEKLPTKKIEDISKIIGDEQREASSLTREAVENVLTDLYIKRKGIGETWDLNKLILTNFTEIVNERYPYHSDKYSVFAYNPQLRIGFVPYEYRATNSIGMYTRMSSPLAIRTSGSLEIVITDKSNITLEKRKVELSTYVHEPSLFYKEQESRFWYDSKDGGLIAKITSYLLDEYVSKLDIKGIDKGKVDKEMDDAIKNMSFEAYFDAILNAAKEEGTLIESAKNLINSEKVKDALQTAIYFEEAILYHSTSNPSVNEFIMAEGNKKNIDPYKYWTGKTKTPTGNRKIFLDISGFGNGFKFINKARRDDVLFEKFKVSSSITYFNADIKSDYYWGGELSINGYFVWDIKVDAKVLFIVEGNKNYYIKELPINFKIRVATSNSPKTYFYESGKQVEDLSLFEKEYAFLSEDIGSARLSVLNSTGIPLNLLPQNKEFDLDVYLNSVYMGTFEKNDFLFGSIILPNLNEKEQSIELSLAYSDGELEHGSGNVNVKLGTTDITIRLEEGLDTSMYWSIILPFLYGVKPEQRLIVVFELFSQLTGYPFPMELVNFDPTDPKTSALFLQWLENYGLYLDSFENDFSFSYNIKGKGFAYFINSLRKISEQIIKSVIEFVNKSTILSMGLEFENVVNTDKHIILIIRGPDAKVKIHFIKSGGKWSLSKETKEGDIAYKPPTKLSGKIIGAIGDILAFISIVQSAYNLYVKTVKFSSTEDPTLIQEISLALDIVKLILQISKFAIEVARKIFTKLYGATTQAALKATSAIIGVVIGVISLVQLFLSELEKACGGNVRLDCALDAVVSLMTGFDEVTLQFWTTVISIVTGIIVAAYYIAVAVGASLATLATLATLAAIAGPVGAIVAVAAIIITLILHWDEICAWWSGEVPKDAIKDVESDLSDKLTMIMKMIGALNDANMDSYIFRAREYYGLGYTYYRLSLYATDQIFSSYFLSLSLYFSDKAESELYQGKYMHYLRFWLIAIFKQADDFVDNDNRYDSDSGEESEGFDDDSDSPDPFDDDDRNYDGDIIVKNKKTGAETKIYNTGSSRITDYLLSINSTLAENLSIKYSISGGVVENGLKNWGNYMGHMGDEISRWNNNFTLVRERSKYVSTYPNPLSYSREYGVITFAIDSEVESIDATIKRTDGSEFSAIVNNEKKTSSVLSLTIKNQGVETSIFISPGSYAVSWTNVKPSGYDLTSYEAKNINVAPYTSPSFGMNKIEIKIVRFFEMKFDIKKLFPYNISLTVNIKDKNGNDLGELVNKDTAKNETLPKEVTIPMKALEPNYLHIKVKLDMDNNGTNGYEGTNETNVYIYLPSYFFFTPPKWKLTILGAMEKMYRWKDETGSWYRLNAKDWWNTNYANFIEVYCSYIKWERV